ncbi:hypothetical protein FHX52_2531 [Humibacillus xanthopallidus]|uniref:Uncharacterized protein n=1 Tax=Humibacillus xanthopallidus TaxID=412689 RepID=A0A543PP34_9MICO|nr:hypothetical protein [Humibacillus xanthopallidus]TQN45831.1 hypothetical protein FHX52_2531 [Humibacillus xanthopallidus]
MLGMREYDGDYIDACRSRVETQTAMFREVAQAARDHGDADLSGLEGALESLESEYFNNMLLVLEGYFVHRLRGVEGKDGNALNEVRVLARSLMENGGTLMEDPQIPLDPERAVLGLKAGEPVRLTLQEYTRLSDAFFRELERRFSAT